MFNLADARNFACQEIAQLKPAGVLFLSDRFYDKKEKQGRCKVPERRNSPFWPQ